LKKSKSDPFIEVGRRIDTIRKSQVGEIETSKRNFKSIPKNATILLEYINCGNERCYKCSYNEYHVDEFGHGPYYYAYWRDKTKPGKLQKKYIGKSNPIGKLEEQFNSFKK
jgi:hypothetical protein